MYLHINGKKMYVNLSLFGNHRQNVKNIDPQTKLEGYNNLK